MKSSLPAVALAALAAAVCAVVAGAAPAREQAPAARQPKAAVATESLPRVVVLDIVTPPGVSERAFLAVTAKLREELASSGDFLVLDRASVMHAATDAGVAISADAYDQDLLAAGMKIAPPLGAAYLVIPRLSFLDGTWFVSGRMVDAHSGAVTMEAASDEAGADEASALLAAARVGASLASGLVQAEPALVTAGVESSPEREGALPEAAADAERPPVRLSLPFSRVAVFAGLPFLSGTLEQQAQALNLDATFPATSLTLHWQQVAWRGLYGELFFDRIAEQTMAGGAASSFLTQMDLQAGAGWTVPLGTAAQAGAGVHAGPATFQHGDYWHDNGARYAGHVYGVELLVDWRLLPPLGLSARADYSLAQAPGVSSQSQLSFMIGAGLTY